MARKIIGAFRQPFRAGGHELQVTTSIGIAVYPDDSEDAGSLLRLADMALYHAKERGRNTFSFYNPVIDTRSTERTRLEAVLRRALERNEFRLYFQPLVSASTGRIVSSEVLLRWQHPERGLLEPGDFFSSAEHIGFLPDIDEWVLRTACRQIRQWLDQGISPPDVTVNLSGVYFQRNVDLPDRVARILEEARLPPEYLNIEISEKVAMDDIERTAARLDGLVEKGVHVSVDGFGAGCSSVKYLNRLPISRLKMDRAFVRDLGADSSDPAIIRAVVLMAHTMNKKVVGEGVETEGQLRFLRMVDCDEVQGYLFSRPVPAEQFRDQMTAGRP